MKLLSAVLFLLSAILLSKITLAATVSETFSERTNLKTTTAIWNQAKGHLHPPMKVKNWNDGSAKTSSMTIGNGSHGAFDSTTWTQLASSVDTAGKIIYLSTATTWQFTNFTLPADWILEPTGDSALVIYVQKDMVVNGTIRCSGRSGTSSTGTGASAVAGSGGLGRCGGARGGNGGSRYSGTATSGENGQTTSTIGGGVGGSTTSAGTGSGGGGGGAWTALNMPGNNSTAGTGGTAGSRGTNSSDSNWDNILGSAGGGGGSGSSTEAGGGGGGGGGVIILQVGGNITVGLNGLISVDGGAGGSAPNDGGAGGAGGGGSVRVWLGGILTLNGNGNNAITAASGTRGDSPAGGDGGSGWAGRTWVSYPAGGASFVAPLSATISPPSELTSEGDVIYETGTSYETISNAIDLSSTLPEWTSVSISGAGSLEVAGSNDGFNENDSGWVQSVNAVQINNYRYFRFKLTFSNASETSPSVVDLLTFNYSKGERKEFDFKASGCGLIKNKPNGQNGYWLFFVIVPLFLLLNLRIKANIPRVISSANRGNVT